MIFILFRKILFFFPFIHFLISYSNLNFCIDNKFIEINNEIPEKEFEIIENIYKDKIPDICNVLKTLKSKSLKNIYLTLDEISLGNIDKNKVQQDPFLVNLFLVITGMISHDSFYYVGNKCQRIISTSRLLAPSGYLFFENGSHSFSINDMVEIKKSIEDFFIHNQKTNTKFYHFINANKENIISNLDYIKDHRDIMYYELK